MPLDSLKNLLLETRGQVALVTVNRPAKRNALDVETISELQETFDRLSADASVSAVILTGSGTKAFVAGADIAELKDLSEDEGREFASRGQRVFSRIEELPKPVIGAVNGFALGGGLELALACHVRIASENAQFAAPEVKLGLMCGYGGTQRLPRAVSQGKALEMLLTGDMIDAQDALRCGLVSRVVPQEALLGEALSLAERMAANAPLALRSTLEAVLRGRGMQPREAMAREAELFSVLCGTADMREGTRAFVEKRTARFQGK